VLVECVWVLVYAVLCFLVDVFLLLCILCVTLSFTLPISCLGGWVLCWCVGAYVCGVCRGCDL